MAEWSQRKLFIVSCLCSIAWVTGAAAQQNHALTNHESASHSTIPSAHAAMSTDRQPVVENHSRPAAAAFPSLQTDDQRPVDDKAAGGTTAPVVTVASSLAVVLGLFAGLVWLTRKFGSSTVRAGSVPNEVLQPLGSTAIDARTRVLLLKCGSRIVVVSQTAQGMQPLCEITDPREVNELTMACTGESTASFADTLKAAQQKAETTPARPRGRLFATA